MATDVLYVDDLALRLIANFAFDYLLVRATAEVTGRPVATGRLAAAAALGTAHDLGYLLAQAGLWGAPQWWRLWPVLVVSSLAMLAVAFGRMPCRQFAAVACRFYAVGFTAAGAGVAAASVFGTPGSPHQPLGMAVACLALVAVAEVGWDVSQLRTWQKLFLVPIEVRFGEVSARLTALVDTGNRLRDPLSAAPVIVVEASALDTILPDPVRRAMADCSAGRWQEVGMLISSSPWSHRFRLIPFTSLGKTGGLLVGFRPDAVSVVVDGVPRGARETVIGLYPHRLDPDGAYQALLHPEVLVDEVASPRPRFLSRHLTRLYLGKERDSAC